MEKVRVGVIGAGGMGAKHIVNIVNGEIPELTLTAIADGNPARESWARENAPDAVFFADGKDMMESGLVDAVIIATPNFTHPMISKQALEHGLHVMCEKPVGIYTKNVHEVIDAADASGKTFAIMFNQRTNPLFKKMRECVQSGQYGAFKSVNWMVTDWYRTQYYYDSGAKKGTWRVDGGGLLLNQAPHNLDILTWICGMPTKVRAILHTGKWHKVETEDDVVTYFEYENGATGVFISNTGHFPGTNRLEINLEKAQLVLEHDKLTISELEMSEREFSVSPQTDIFAKPPYTNFVYETDEPYPMHNGVLSAFGSHILNGTPLTADGREGMNSLTLANAMALSSWLGREVSIPFDEDLYYEMLQEKTAHGEAIGPTYGQNNE